MAPTPREVFFRLVNGVADARFDELPDLYGDETDVRHPMATPAAEPMTSRAELAEHFTVPPGKRASFPKRRVVDAVVHETTDPEVIVAEFGYAYDRPDGSVLTVPCVFVMRIRDGKIIESRDYIDPIRGRQARDAVDDLITAIRRAASG
jgi:ketosteroid isomerase-like protein